jgi:hypothetical protein
MSLLKDLTCSTMASTLSLGPRVCCAEIGLHKEAQEVLAEFNAKRPPSFNPLAYIRMHVATCRRIQIRTIWLDGYRNAGFLTLRCEQVTGSWSREQTSSLIRRKIS